MTMRTHTVATSAFHVVSARANQPPADAQDVEKLKKKYGALAHRLPGMILQNGLAQATGFLLAKGKSEHLALLNDLNQVLRESHATNTDNGNALHQQIIGAGLDRTMQLTRRALEAAGWINRYVQGVLRVDATGNIAPQETHHDN